MDAVKIGAMRLTRLPLSALTDFQGRFKGMTKQALVKLGGELQAQGLAAVVTVWQRGRQYLILDGHQRVAALRAMEAQGTVVPLVPAVVIPADSEEDARKKVLALASVHGRVDGAGLTEFLRIAGLSMDEAAARFQFPEFDFSEFRRQAESQAQKGGSNEGAQSSGQGGQGAQLKPGEVSCPRCRKVFTPG